MNFKPNEIFSKQILDSLPTEIINHLTKQMINKLNLVTREEFDVQAKILSRTRQKLEDLEKKLTALSANAASPDF